MQLHKGNRLRRKGTCTFLSYKVRIEALEVNITGAHQYLVTLSFLGPQRTPLPSPFTRKWGSCLVLAKVAVADAVHVTSEPKCRTGRHEISMFFSSPRPEMAETPGEGHLQPQAGAVVTVTLERGFLLLAHNLVDPG